MLSTKYRLIKGYDEPMENEIGGFKHYLHNLNVPGGLDPDLAEDLTILLENGPGVGFVYVISPGQDVYGDTSDYHQFIWSSDTDLSDWFFRQVADLEV